MSSKFDVRQALRNLDIEEKPFGYTGGMGGESSLPMVEREGLRGYSHDRWLAINPDEKWPAVVRFHEMAHILRGDTTSYKHFDIKPNQRKEDYTFDDMINRQLFSMVREMNGDLIETECHITGIMTAVITDSPADIVYETKFVVEQYSLGREIPDSVVRNALANAKKIWAAGRVGAGVKAPLAA